ncbi:hypothetical protein DY000_02006784 [Brassica cretica]|uniref:Arabidopsis retrotransposon Orf1 C-terminal domain-containing protein n=1 Tax=Brassica cretica TaxID=69181 RepID=A0ABQ7C9J3_BRACR|nr:hypothetical protein DY000_02006784 [Brassica cretica]
MMNEWRTQRKFDTGSTSAAPLPPPVNDGDPWLREREGEPIPLFSHFDNPSTAVSIEPTRFVDPDMIRQMGIREDLEDIFVELGMGNMATNPHVLYPQLNSELQRASVLGFVGRSQFWEHIASGIFDSGSATPTDISHPTLRYFMKVLDPDVQDGTKKVRVQELSLVYYTVRSLVHMEDITEPDDEMWPNLGALFAEQLVKLKMKPFQSARAKKEMVGSLLTPIFRHCRVPLDDALVDEQLIYMDAARLSSAHWLKDGRLIELPRRSVTDFSGGLTSIQFHPDPRLLRAPSTMPSRYTIQRAGGPQ